MLSLPPSEMAKYNTFDDAPS
jgi:hypothetical protein